SFGANFHQSLPPFAVFPRLFDLIRPVVPAAIETTCKRIRKTCEMPAGFPNSWVHGDGGIEPDHIVSQMNIVAPPETLHIVLELNAERPVVLRGTQSSVNFTRLKNEPAPLGQRHDLVHVYH